MRCAKVQLSLIATLTEFLGYDRPAAPVTVYVDGKKQKVPAPLPHFRVRSVTNSATLWDGQTLVVGGMIAERINRVKDKVPVLGDIPLLGRLFRSESQSTEKHQLVVFITPTLIDPAGNAAHTEEEISRMAARR